MVIKFFDSKDKEVLINAKIVQVTLNDQFRMGIDWEVLLSTLNDLNFKADFGLSPVPTSFGQIKVGLLNANEKVSYETMVQLLRTVGETNLLSSPRITVLNNEEARIVVGSSRPYITNTVVQTTGTATVAEAVTFVELGVQLYVTPRINDDGFVTMKIRPVISSAPTSITTAQGNVIPIVEKSEAETVVSVKDGVTIVIAGLIDTTDTNIVNKIPFLGNIPFIGNVFKNTEEQFTKKEIVIFLTPHIISGDRLNKEASLDSDKIVEPLGTKMLGKKEEAIGRETIDR